MPGVAGNADVTPKGDRPGFALVLDKKTIAIPDRPGNNRLDSLENIVTTGQVGLIFMIPGVDETLRVNGSATLSGDEGDIDLCATERRRPKLVIRVAVREAYLHCAKALLRSKLWTGEFAQPKGTFPSIARMIGDQVGSRTNSGGTAGHWS